MDQDLERLRARLKKLDDRKAAIEKKLEPLLAEEIKAQEAVAKAQAAYTAVKTKIVALEESEGLRDLSRERSQVARAVVALGGGPQGMKLEGGSIGTAP